MKMFVHKVTGWDVPVGPMQFRSEGLRKIAIELLEDGTGLVVLAGTKGKGTPDKIKGRLLGIMQITTEKVDIEKDFPEFIKQAGSSAKNKNGEYKWPYGLINLRAWSLIKPPKLTKISDRFDKLGQSVASTIVALRDEEADFVKKLVWQEEELVRPNAHIQRRIEKKYGTAKRSAPPPWTTRRGLMHMRRSPAYTYAMEIIGTNSEAFKIGWAFDYQQRARQFNHAAMPELGGLEYKPILYNLSETAREAYAMEQSLLSCFNGQLHPDNREIILGVSRSQLESAWCAALNGSA